MLGVVPRVERERYEADGEVQRFAGDLVLVDEAAEGAVDWY